MNDGNCRYCGKSLIGKRIEARYCRDSHRVLDYMKRKRLGVKEQELGALQ